MSVTRLNDCSFSLTSGSHFISFDRNCLFLSGILMLNMLNFDPRFRFAALLLQIKKKL